MDTAAVHTAVGSLLQCGISATRVYTIDHRRYHQGQIFLMSMATFKIKLIVDLASILY